MRAGVVACCPFDQAGDGDQRCHPEHAKHRTPSRHRIPSRPMEAVDRTPREWLVANYRSSRCSPCRNSSTAAQASEAYTAIAPSAFIAIAQPRA